MKKSRSILIIVLLLVFIAIACGLVTLFWWLTDGFRGDPKTFIVTVDKEIYTTDTTGVHISRDTKIKVTSFADYDIQILAYGTEKNNFSFTIGAEEYQWKDKDGADFTKAFTIDKSDTDKAFAITYGTVSDMFTSVIPGYDMTFAYEDIENVDMFDLVISSAGTQMTLRFSIDVRFPVDGVEITPPEIVF